MTLSSFVLPLMMSVLLVLFLIKISFIPQLTIWANIVTLGLGYNGSNKKSCLSESLHLTSTCLMNLGKIVAF